LIARSQPLKKSGGAQGEQRAGVGHQTHGLANGGTALPYRSPHPTEAMRKNRFVTITIWVVVIGMVLSLSLAVVGFFQ
jgi:hypothetical protein